MCATPAFPDRSHWCMNRLQATQFQDLFRAGTLTLNHALRRTRTTLEAERRDSHRHLKLRNTSLSSRQSSAHISALICRPGALTLRCRALLRAADGRLCSQAHQKKSEAEGGDEDSAGPLTVAKEIVDESGILVCTGACAGRGWGDALACVSCAAGFEGLRGMVQCSTCNDACACLCHGLWGVKGRSGGRLCPCLAGLRLQCTCSCGGEGGREEAV